MLPLGPSSIGDVGLTQSFSQYVAVPEANYVVHGGSTGTIITGDLDLGDDLADNDQYDPSAFENVDNINLLPLDPPMTSMIPDINFDQNITVMHTSRLLSGDAVALSAACYPNTAIVSVPIYSTPGSAQLHGNPNSPSYMNGNSPPYMN